MTFARMEATGPMVPAIAAPSTTRTAIATLHRAGRRVNAAFHRNIIPSRTTQHPNLPVTLAAVAADTAKAMGTPAAADIQVAVDTHTAGGITNGPRGSLGRIPGKT